MWLIIIGHHTFDDCLKYDGNQEQTVRQTGWQLTDSPKYVKVIQYFDFPSLGLAWPAINDLSTTATGAFGTHNLYIAKGIFDFISKGRRNPSSLYNMKKPPPFRCHNPRYPSILVTNSLKRSAYLISINGTLRKGYFLELINAEKTTPIRIPFLYI